MEYSPIFEPLFSDTPEDPRYYQVYGGRGSGKSVAVAGASVIKTYACHKVLYLRQVMDSQEDSTIEEVKAAIQDLKVENDFVLRKNKFINIKTGGTISFKGIQSNSLSSAKLKSLSGITTVVIEEAEEIKDFEEFSKIDEGIRVLGKNLKVILVYNPGSAITSWIHKEWFIDGKPNPERFHDTVYMHSTYLDNLKNLAPSTIKRYEDLRDTNPTYYIHTILAEWTINVSNRIYDGWGTVPSISEDIIKTVYGLDFGYGGNDTTALIRNDHGESGIHYIRELIVKPKLLIKELIYEMKQLEVPPDADIYADSAVPNFITEIKQGGFRKCEPIHKYQNSVEQEIKKLQGQDIVMVGENQFLYHRYSTFKRLKSGKLPHEPDVLAALRYSEMGGNNSYYQNGKSRGRIVSGGKYQ